MVTMNGEECHNEWEITFEEIHRNAAIAYGVFDYIRHTQDWGYLAEGGFEVLLGISRFWSQRVNWSQEKEAYVMLGVTGPNEYENNINNNWYTNRMAAWTLEWTLEAHHWLKENAADALSAITSKTALNADTEFAKWSDIIAKMYYPKSEKLGVVLQQDGFLTRSSSLQTTSAWTSARSTSTGAGTASYVRSSSNKRTYCRLLLLEPPPRKK